MRKDEIMTEKQPPQEKKPIYTNEDVDTIAQLMQSIYALDDAIANQEALKRPQSFILPLKNIRESVHNGLNAAFAKGQPKKTDNESKPDSSG